MAKTENQPKYIVITETNSVVTKIGKLNYDATRYEVVASGSHREIVQLVGELNKT